MDAYNCVGTLSRTLRSNAGTLFRLSVIHYSRTTCHRHLKGDVSIELPAFQFPVTDTTMEM